MEYIAHRGASAYAPENTLDAFELALSMGMSSLELDIQLSADGELVVHHDLDLKRTAGADVKIADCGYAGLLRYDVAAHFPGAKRPQRIPTLAQALALVGGRGFVNVEIKNDRGIYAGIEHKLLEVLRTCGNGWPRRAAVSSFYHPSLETVRRLDPEIKIGVLASSSVSIGDAVALAVRLRAESVNINARRFTPEAARAAHSRGLKMLLYTVNDRRRARELESMGADGIFTNNPDICQDGWNKTGGTDD
ncbi:MAG: glycerophosphodiester phosphodiesterase family protein [Elusimicrobiales bacterium]|nr:glycerophosphodiester phosphodiesterase family protein [Elusimicrobiales bacterium]